MDASGGCCVQSWSWWDWLSLPWSRIFSKTWRLTVGFRTVNAYETRWAGCAKQVVERIEEGALDAMVFTSTAEVEGLLKSFEEFGLDWEIAKKRCPKILVAAHGLITVAGAHMLGVTVDLVSFEGVVDALHTEISRLS